MHVTSFNLERVLSFLEPYILSNVLSFAWLPATAEVPTDREHRYPYHINKREAFDLGIELQRRFGFDPAPRWGVCKVCYTHTTAVLKIPIHEAYAPIVELEIDDINTRWPDPNHKKYFPYTFSVGDGIAVQERCRLMTKSEYITNMAEITMLAAELGLWDFHDENVGMSMDGATFKFFDVQREQHLKLIGNVQSTARRYAICPLDGSPFKGYFEESPKQGV